MDVLVKFDGPQGERSRIFDLDPGLRVGDVARRCARAFGLDEKRPVQLLRPVEDEAPEVLPEDASLRCVGIAEGAALEVRLGR